MKIKLKIQQKIQFFILTASVLIFLIALGIISFKARKSSFEDAIQLTDKYVSEVAKDIGGQLTANLRISKTLAKAFLVYKDFDNETWQNTIRQMYMDVFVDNPQIYAIWDSWEFSAIDSAWTKPYGRIANTIWREDNEIKYTTEIRSLDGDSELYTETKSTLVPSINEPYMDIAISGREESFLMTSLNAPIMENGVYVGVVSLDITLNEFQEIIDQIKPFDGSYSFLVSHKGFISGHPDASLLNTSIVDLFPDDNKEFKIAYNILNGKSFTYRSEDKDGNLFYYTYAPVIVDDTDTDWSIAIAVPIQVIKNQANKDFYLSLIIGVIGIILMSLIISFIGKNITFPIKNITGMLNKLAEGTIVKEMKLKFHSGDEIEDMARALNTSIDGFISKQEFADNIGKGNLQSELNLLGDNDTLGRSLLEMRDNLEISKKEEEKRKLEDQKRKWANEGLAKFGDILRQNNDDIEILAGEIIQNLVNYLDANQGGVFILNDEDKNNIHFRLIAAYAYNRRKHKQKTILFGEGLIGTAALERKSTYLTNIPQNYIEITSGLGGSNPNALLIIPLMLEDNVLGVMEIASFKEIENHEIEFVEKIGESIASTLHSVKINIQTTQLLEKSQQQAEEMAAQEEEMRQNMEELQATQEESSRKGLEMEGLVQALNSSSYVVEYDLDGYIIHVNDNYLNFLNLSQEEMIGSHHSKDMDFTGVQKAEYAEFWADLCSGNTKKEKSKITIRDKSYTFSETYTPIRDENDEIYKILKISNDLDDFEEKLL